MKYLLIPCLILGLSSCQSQENNKQKKMIQAYQHLNNSRPLYGIGINIPGPYEVYINDIKAYFDNSPAMHNLGVDINPYVLKSGKYNFRVRVYPMPSEAAKGGIQPQTAKDIQVSLDYAEKNMEGPTRVKAGTYKVLQSYPAPVINKPVPYIDITGAFEVNLPYELEGWSNGRDLRKMDSAALAQKVVAYYQKLWDILNDGDGEAWKILTERRRQETAIFNYSDEQYFKATTEKGISEIQERKNRMAALEDYEMKLYAQGRIVALERKSHTTELNKQEFDAKGESPLIRYGQVSGYTLYPVKLYLPSNSNEFVIIRK